MSALRSRSTLAFLAATLALLAIKLLFDLYPVAFPGADQAAAFTWPIVASLVVIGLLGLLAERSIGLPDALADYARERRGAIMALLTGLAYGLVTVGQDWFVQSGASLAGSAGSYHVPWPWSVPFYTFGAIFLEFLLRLGALCILVWIVHVAILRRRWLMPVFWIVNLIVAFYEIMPATMAAAAASDWTRVALTPLQPLYWTNVFEGWLLLRYGWLSPIVFRLAFYLIWHVIYGGFASA